MTPDDFDPARGYDDNPPACLRCDAKDQEIEALRQQVARLREAGERAAYLLRVSSEYCAGVADYDHGDYDTITYDDAECDGLCLSGDCQTAADDIAAVLASLEATR